MKENTYQGGYWKPTRFLLDQSLHPGLLSYLRDNGYDATRIGTDYPSDISRVEAVAIARQEGRILITGDRRHFAELMIRREDLAPFVIFGLQLGDHADLSAQKQKLSDALKRYSQWD